MEDPAGEIRNVIKLLTATVSPDIQREAVEKFYASNVEFRHPLCRVPAGPRSRDALLGIYQWYRVLSPTIKIQVPEVTYDSEKDELFVECIQEFHIRLSPFKPAPSRLLVHLKLRRSEMDENLRLIAYHEDFYHPDDLTALLLPPLLPIVRGLLLGATILSDMGARVGSITGLWTVRREAAKKD